MTTDAAPARLNDSQRWIATGKDLLALLRDLVLVLLFLMLLMHPGFIGDRLSRAGFEEGSLMGFTWKNRAQDYGAETVKLKNALEAAKRELLVQAGQLRRNEEELARLSASAESPQQAQRIDQMVERNQAIVQHSLQTSVNVAEQLRASQPVVAEAREAFGDTAEWAVIMGADKGLEEARYESRQAILRGISNVGLYQRDGTFRTVALAGSREEAEAKLQMALTRNKTAYIVEFDKWCPKRETRKSHTLCVAQ